MAKHLPNRIRYKHPLPIRPIEPPLPDVIIYNPVSWCYFIYKWYQSTNLTHHKIPVKFVQTGKDTTSRTCNNNGTVRIMITDKDDMLYLWDNGFFGSGTLSRSEPTWYERYEQKLEENNDHGKNGASKLNLEKVTEWRRLQRLKFKKEREKYEKELLQFRIDSGSKMTIEDEQKLIETQRESLRLYKKQIDEETVEYEKNSRKVDIINIEEEEERDDDKETEDEEFLKSKDLEMLELQPVEATFLTWALPVLQLSTHELFSKLFPVDYDQMTEEIYQFIIQYVTYHHYRSHGWCVKSGIKFGCEYLLYKRGPPFQHAEFCIMVMDAREKEQKHKDYTWYSTISRVCSVARKTMILCYVEPLVDQDTITQLWREKKYINLFQAFQINEIIYKRWVPGKNRD